MKKQWIIAIGVVVLFLVNIFFGSVHIDSAEVMSSLLGRNGDAMVNFIVIDSRLPQAVTALLVGASLAVAGLLLQTALHNPLAGPSVLGISGGASLGVALVTLGASWLGLPFLSSGVSVTTVALIGALAVTIILLMLNSLLRNNLVLLVAGLLLGYLISGIITILNVVATADNLQSYVMWGMGDFSSVSLRQLPFLSLSLVILMIFSVMMTKPLNAIMLGDSYAENLGVNIRRTRNMLLLIVGCITALTTAYCGPVAFIGLAVPHIARMIVRTDNFLTLIPMTLLSGAAVALLCNAISTLPSATVLPINAVTPIIGVPVILYVIIRRK